MIELHPTELQQTLSDNKNTVLFIYTPLCGTCKIAERMLNVVEELRPTITIYKCNINLFQKEAQLWKIESIPCLLLMKRHFILKKVYAMQSVEHILNVLSPYSPNV